MACWLNCQGAAVVSHGLGNNDQFDTFTAMTTMSGPPLASSDCKVLPWQNPFWFQRCWTIKRQCNIESTKYILFTGHLCCILGPTCIWYHTVFVFFFLKIISFICFGHTGSLCCAWAFCGCGERGLLPSCSVRASHCGGFSCSGAGTPGHTGFSSRGSWA